MCGILIRLSNLNMINQLNSRYFKFYSYLRKDERNIILIMKRVSKRIVTKKAIPAKKVKKVIENQRFKKKKSSR